MHKNIEETNVLTHLNLTVWPDYVFDIQMAIYNKIMEYKGGYKGVYKAILDRFKPEQNENSKLNEEAFRKSVERLQNRSSHNEKIAFGIRGNIILFMHVLEILQINKFSELIKGASYIPNVESHIIDSNIKIEEIKNKLIDITEIINMNSERKPRLRPIKVYRDWETVLNYMNNLKNIGKDDLKTPGFHDLYLGDKDKIIKLAYYFFIILKQFTLYFSQDKLLYSFYKDILTKLPISGYSNAFEITLPLFFLYFALLIHSKFLSILLNKLPYEPFIYKSISKNGDEFSYKSIEDILHKEIKIVNKKNKENIKENLIGKYIMKENKAILHYIKNILSYYKEGVNDNPNIDGFSYFLNTVSILYNLYTYHVDISNENILDFFKSINTINDLYEKLSLGEPHFYYINQDIIEGLYNIKHNLSVQLDKIIRKAL